VEQARDDAFQTVPQTVEQDALNGDLPSYTFIGDDEEGFFPSRSLPQRFIGSGDEFFGMRQVGRRMRAALLRLPGPQQDSERSAYDEHGGLYDHVPPPPATPPGGPYPDGFTFDRFGVFRA
jgi:phospholipase C